MCVFLNNSISLVMFLSRFFLSFSFCVFFFELFSYVLYSLSWLSCTCIHMHLITIFQILIMLSTLFCLFHYIPVYFCTQKHPTTVNVYVISLWVETLIKRQEHTVITWLSHGVNIKQCPPSRLTFLPCYLWICWCYSGSYI